MTGTLEEPEVRATAPVRLLIHVLCYDDLLREVAMVLRLDDTEPPLSLRRAADDEPTGLAGRGELRIADRWLSSLHAVLDRHGAADVIADEDSRNGTWVNGQRIREHALADGDLIEVGHSLFCYRQVDAAAAAALAGPEPPRLGPTRTACAEVALLVADLRRIATSRQPVLVLGETGVGKEIAAEAVHGLSGRAGAYCAVDCGAIPESLFEATFFGHRRGAFTGAVEARTGEILRAAGGTLFLDEVGNMPPSCQAKLLRVIEDGRVTPIGAAAGELVDVRWVAATNRDLLGDDAGFRADLLRRLAGYVARLPPLRRRREDLGLLSAHLLRVGGVERAAITAAAGRRLYNDPFPGNIRQLRAALQSAAQLAGAEPIDVAQLGELDAAPPAAAAEAPAAEGRPRTRGRAEVEQALADTGGNVVHAAERLGTHARQVYRWIERYAIDLERYRAP